MSIADDKARNTLLADKAHQAVFNLRFEGSEIPPNVWNLTGPFLDAVTAWRDSGSKRAPEKKETA